ncbi:MAG: alkaline phosphatase family protein [Bacteroidales bacterium]|nr:alkaline phosphatase family protein [Bacteroidales bacterium]
MRRETLKGILVTALLIVLPLVFISSGREKSGRIPGSYVVLVSMDAFRWDYSDIYKTPNLDKMAAGGVKADRLISSFPTNTFPNHYSIATGLYPDNHGIVNNTFFAPDLGLLYRIGDRSAVENPAFYKGEPVWVTAQKQGLIAASFYWVGSEAPVAGMHPYYWKKYDESISYGDRIDSVVKWLGYPVEKRPGLITLYFDEPDATSHDYGPVSPETGGIVSLLDSLIGVLQLKLSLLPHAKKINLIVLSDHGMAEVSSDRYINLREIVPPRMIRNFYGGNPVIMIDPAEGKKDSILFLINRTEGVRAWTKETLPERWHYGKNPRINEIVAVADSSWYLATRPPAGKFRGGAHGYDNRNPDMYGIFYATGPAFKKGFRTEELNNVDIYNLVCRILKIKPAPNDGDISHIKPLLKKRKA